MKNTYTFLLLLFICATSVLYSQDDEFFESVAKVGGYGELHYNVVEKDGKETEKTLDFHRFVLFYSYQWSEKWSFNAEVELEHNLVDDDSGELELEQAYVNYRHSDAFGFRAGVVLNSVGILNETHEPPTFLSVERPAYSKYIIPTTWFGNGAQVFGGFGDFVYTATVMEGLDNDKLTQNNILKQGIRSGRQKGFKADARTFLYNANLRFTGIRGLRLGTSYSYNKAMGDSTSNNIGVFEIHGQFRSNNIIVNAEFGNITYSEGEIQSSNGYYIDLGYDFGDIFKTDMSIIPFFRYTNYNTASSTISGGSLEQANNNSKWMIGLSVNPIEQVSFKVDYGVNTVELGNVQTNLFNVGVGYMF